MKKDYYFPHEIRTRNDEAVMELIECEGASGYGIYRALMEYLRTQDDYTGDVRILKTLARQLKTSVERQERIQRSMYL